MEITTLQLTKCRANWCKKKKKMFQKKGKLNIISQITRLRNFATNLPPPCMQGVSSHANLTGTSYIVNFWEYIFSFRNISNVLSVLGNNLTE